MCKEGLLALLLHPLLLLLTLSRRGALLVLALGALLALLLLLVAALLLPGRRLGGAVHVHANLKRRGQEGSIEHRAAGHADALR